MTMPRPPLIIMTIEQVKRFNQEEPFNEHPEFFKSINKHHEFGFHHPLLGWLKVLVSDFLPIEVTEGYKSDGLYVPRVVGVDTHPVPKDKGIGHTLG